MRIHINIENSISNQRLNYRFPNRWEKLDHLYFFAFSALLIGPAVILLTKYDVLLNRLNFGSLAVGIIVALGLLALYTLLRFDKLIRFKGISQKVNAELMSKIIATNFGIEPARSGAILKYYRRPSIWKMGKRVIVILHGEDVLINIATFNFRNIRSPLHGLFDRVKIGRMKRDFNRLKENYTA